MNLAEQIGQLVGRGFSEERAETIVVMREAAIIIFDAFPETLVLVGGANLVLFQDSVRHSADLDFFPISGELPDVVKLSEVLLTGLAPLAKLLNLHPMNLKTISSEGGLIKLMLSSNNGRALFTVDITKIGSVLKSGIEELLLEATALNREANIRFVSRDQLLLNKAEAFLLRRVLKARDAYDAMDLLAKGASLTGNLRNHLEDMLYGEFDADRIRERIGQVDAKRCRAELKDNLPDEVYQKLEKQDFQPLRAALTTLFRDWLGGHTWTGQKSLHRNPEPEQSSKRTTTPRNTNCRFVPFTQHSRDKKNGV